VGTERKSVTLSRDDLLRFSSEQFEDFVSQVTDAREPTQSEKNELKRQRRLIKNRESAQASRQRKKSRADELERKVNDLTNENSVLKENISALSTENAQLKSEVGFLQAVVNKSGITNMFSLSPTNYTSNFSGKQQNGIPPGLVLMVVLFSFGLFFGSLGPNSGFTNMGKNSPRIFHREEFESTASGNDLLNILSEQEMPVHRLQKAYKRILARDTRHREENSLNEILEGEDIKHSNGIFQLEPNTTYLLENIWEKWERSFGENLTHVTITEIEKIRELFIEKRKIPRHM